MVERIYSIDEIKELLYPLLDSVPVSRAILFGSYARNEATAASDIDLFVDTGGNLTDWDFCEFCDKLSDTTQKKMDIIEKIDVDPLSGLYHTIHSEGVTIYG